MNRPYGCAATKEVEAQRRRGTFYEVIIFYPLHFWDHNGPDGPLPGEATAETTGRDFRLAGKTESAWAKECGDRFPASAQAKNF